MKMISVQKQQMCNLKFLLLIRFICGYHVKLVSPTLRYLSYVYRTILIIVIISLNIIHYERNDLWVLSYFVEYIIYIMISWRTRDEYISRFYQRIWIIDTLPSAADMYKKLSIFLVGILLFNIWVRICYSAIACYQNDNCFSLHCNYSAMIYLLRDVGPVSITMIFSLVYLRLSVVRRTIETKGVNHINVQKYSAKNYIEMYVTLVDSMNDIAPPLKLMVLFDLFIKTQYFSVSIIE